MLIDVYISVIPFGVGVVWWLLGRIQQKGRSGWCPGGLVSECDLCVRSEPHGAAGRDAYWRALLPVMTTWRRRDRPQWRYRQTPRLLPWLP